MYNLKVRDNYCMDGKAIYQLCPHCGKYLCSAEAISVDTVRAKYTNYLFLETINAAFVCECGASWVNAICNWSKDSVQ